MNDEEEDLEDGLLPGLKFFKLHGSMTQVERSSVFKEFRVVRAGVLLCTVSNLTFGQVGFAFFVTLH